MYDTLLKPRQSFRITLYMCTTTDYTKTLTFAKYFSNCYFFNFIFKCDYSYAQKY